MRIEEEGPILLTGATGFIGGHVLARLKADGRSVRVLTRRPMEGEDCIVGDILDEVTVKRAVAGVRTVVHVAGFAHAFDMPEAELALRHEEINHQATRRLAECAAQAGVRRMVFCSSVKAMGEPGPQCADESLSSPPDSAYGRAKRAAEQALLECGKRSGMETVVLRLSMVYGPGSRGNLERMLRQVAARRFPALPETGNHRSMVFVGDAADAVVLAAFHPAAANRLYIVAHPQAASGRQLFQAMRRVCGLPQTRWAVPERMLRLLGRGGDLVGRIMRRAMPVDSQVVSRLLDSAWYSSAALQQELGWRPAVDIERGLALLWRHGQEFGNEAGKPDGAADEACV